MYCDKCGSKLDPKTELCPNCDTMPAPKKPNKKKRVIALITAFAVLVGLFGGYFGFFYQAKATIQDMTSQGGGAAAGDGGDTENRAVINQNVKAFTEEEAADINDSIEAAQVTNCGLYLTVEKGTPLESIGVGDIFYLDGSEDTPLGETYFGKIAAVDSTGTHSTTYLLETPMVDEVFDVLSIQYTDALTAEDVCSVETMDGVSLYAKDGPQAMSARSGHLASTSPTEDKDPPIGVTIDGDTLMFEILDLDLLEAFGLKEPTKGKNKEVDSQEARQEKVYTTDKGKCYHTETCHYLHSSKHETNLTKALEDGYRACSICKPPVLTGTTLENELKLNGKVGLENLDFDMTFDWDILSGDGLENCIISAKGNFTAQLKLTSGLDLSLKGADTEIKIPSDNVKLQGLENKRFPLVFVTFNGATFTASTILSGSSHVETATMAVPLSVGAMIYVDIHGNLSMEATASVTFNYPFECTYTAVENYDLKNEFDCSGSPELAFDFDFTAKCDFDAHAGASVMVYVFNMNLAELAVAKVGVEGNGSVNAHRNISLTSLTEGWKDESTLKADFYLRGYVKILDARLRLRAKAELFWGLVDANVTVDLQKLFRDITIFEWGTLPPTNYSTATMSYGALTASDSEAVYYKDANGALIREKDNYKTSLYTDSFFYICGIDDTYLYVLLPTGGSYDVCRVAKDGSNSRVILTGVKYPLGNDQKYFYYLDSFDDTTIMRLDREGLDSLVFSEFDHPITFMSIQDDSFYVVELEDSLSASFFGTGYHYYTLDKDGNISADHGTSPGVRQMRIWDCGSYYYVSKPASTGFLRSTAKEVHWMSLDMVSSVKTDCLSGWNPVENVGIFTTQNSSSSSTGMQIVLYRAADGVKVPVTEVEHDCAFFTLSQSRTGNWYFFDQNAESLILYEMSADFSTKTVVKTIPISEINCNLTSCAMTIMNNRIYFYTIPNNSTSTMLYRHDLT